MAEVDVYCFIPAEHESAGTLKVSTDVNQDGHSDLVVLNGVSRELTVLLGTGTGSLTASQVVDVPGEALDAQISLHATDFDTDGDPDIAIVTGTTLLILTNDGGLLTTAPTEEFAVEPFWPSDLADANADGRPDLIGESFAGVTAIELYLNNPMGLQKTDLSADVDGACYITSISSGLVNADAHSDLLVVSSCNGPAEMGPAAILLGSGMATFTLHHTFTVGKDPVATHLADVDADAALDAIVVNALSDDISIRRGLGDGTFAPGELVIDSLCDGCIRATSALAADLDGDGFADELIVHAELATSYKLVVIMDPSAADKQSIVIDDAARSMAIADFNEDGISDIVYSRSPSNEIIILNSNP